MVYTPTRPHAVYRLLVALDAIEPPIWRLIDIPATHMLNQLHDVLQWAMGWRQRHRYYFYRGEFAYLDLPSSQAWNLGKERDANEIALEKIFGRRRRYIEYVYDMNDQWRHHIWLEDEFLAHPHRSYPCLVDGARACPPEEFGGAQRYQLFLAGELEEEDVDFESFDPERFDPGPRAFPEAKVLIFDEARRRKDQRFPRFDPQALDMLGSLAEPTLQLIADAGPDLGRELRRSLEDLVLTEDSLPPLVGEIFEDALSEGLPIDDLLVEIVLHHQELSENYSFAPLHAAMVLSRWASPKAIDAFWAVLRSADDDQEGTIDTMIEGLNRSPEGTERLLDGLDQLSQAKGLRAIQVLVEAGRRDDRLLRILRDEMQKGRQASPTVPFTLGFYGGPEARQILEEALREAILPIEGDSSRDSFSDEALAEQADYALFLANMVTEAGGEPSITQQKVLRQMESFFWSDDARGPGDSPRP